MATIQIQPQEQPNFKLPYPYFIDTQTGDVGRQDVWKGDPRRLMGFQNRADVQRVDVFLEDFAANPEAAIGKYPVFLRDDATMYNTTTPIESITIIQEPTP